MNYPKVSIIILNWNGLQDTIECLESLKKISYPNYKVIVVDNYSEGDDVKTLSGKFKDYIHVIENDRNYGFAEGNNIGIRYALNQGVDYVLLLNNDTVVHPDFLTELVKEVLKGREIGIAGSKMYYHSRPDEVCVTGNFINYWTGDLFSIKRRGSDTAHVEYAIEVDWVSGCCMLISRDVLLNVGLLDNSYSLYYEDPDICIRAARKGYKSLFVPSSKIWHKISTRLAFRNRNPSFYGFYAYSLVRNRFLLMQKHWSKPQFITSSICYIASWPKLFVEYLIYYRNCQMLMGFIRGIIASIKRNTPYKTI